MDNIKTYNEAKIAFKNSEGREPNMNNTEDMRIISAIQLGIQHILKMADKKYTEEDIYMALEFGRSHSSMTDRDFINSLNQD